MRILQKYVLLLVLVVWAQFIWAQFPIETRIILQPPYPLNLDAYEEFLGDGLLEVTNNTSFDIDVFFEVELTEESGLVSLISDGVLSTPYTAKPGTSILSIIEIQEVFAGITFDNFTIGGLTQEQQNAFLLNRQIPEGSYRLCIRAFDELQQPLSDPTSDGCHDFELLFPERPIIDIPFDEDMVDTLGFVNITWSHFLSDPAIRDRTEYVLKIIDITEQKIQDIQNDMANPGISPDYEENEGSVRTKTLLNNVDLPLVPGHKYGLRVTAMDPFGETSYGFSGHSEIVTFTYGEVEEEEEAAELLAGIEIISPENSGFVNPDSLSIPLSWKHIVEDTTLYPFLSYSYKIVDMDTLKITSISQADFENDRYDYVFESGIATNDTILRSSPTNLLVPDHQYALIMQVESSDDRFEFENDGITEVVIFIMGEEEDEEDLEEGCGGDCLAELPKNTREVEIKKSETYFMGKHMLTVDQVAKDQVNGGYEGKGYITLNFMSSVKVNVEFSGLKANKQKIVFDGEADAIFDTGVTPTDGLAGFAAASTMNVDYEKAKNLSTALRSGGKLVSALAGQKTSLPLGFDRDVDGEKIIIGITEMSLTPTKAVLTALFSMENPEWGKYVPVLAATDICFTRTGFGSVVKLQLQKDFEIPLSNEQLVLKASEGGSATEKGTYCIIDCNGFKEGQITAEVGIPREVLVPENEDGTIQEEGFAKLTLNGVFSKANDFMLSASMSPCQIPGLEGFSFQMENGYYDFSDRMNPDGIAFPQGYERAATDKLWKGVWFSNVTVKAPQDWGFADEESRTSASIRNLIKDDTGISIVGTVDNLVSIETGSIEGFAASIDQLKLDIIRGQFKKVSLTGRLGLPILSEGEYLEYEGLVDREEKTVNSGTVKPDVTPENEPLSMSFVVTPNEDGYDLDWIKAHVDFEETSQFVLTKNKEEQGFKALVSGTLSMESESTDTANDKRDTGAPEIELPSLKFEGMEISRMTSLVTGGANTKPVNPQAKKTSPFKFVSPTFSFQGFSFGDQVSDPTSNTTTGNTTTTVLQTTAKKEDEASSKPAKMNGFSLSLDNVAMSFGSKDGGDNEAIVEVGTPVFLSFTPTVMLVGGQNKQSGAGGGAKPAAGKKDKGFAISATGSFTIEAMVNKEGDDMTFTYKDFSLDSFAIGGEIGPIKVDGKLGFYQEDPTFGNGAVASLAVEMPMVDINMQARFGKKASSLVPGTDYSYWYFFAEVAKTMPGIPIVKAGPYFSLWGFKGGAYYHMDDKNPEAFTADERYVPDENVSLGVSAGIRFSITEPNVVWADAEFGIQFNKEYGLDKVSLKAEAYMLQAEPKPMAGTDIDGIKVLMTAQLNIKKVDDQTDVSFDANCSIFVNLGGGLMKGNYDPDTANMIVRSTMHVSANKFSIIAGRPSKPGSVLVGIPDLATVQATAYFMAGKDVAFEEATLDPFITNLLGRTPADLSGANVATGNESNRTTADGLAVGLKVDYKLDIQASILYANFRAMFGFDFSMTNAKAGTVCSNNNNQPLGMGGYYADGQVFAGMSGDMGLDIDLFFYTGKVSLAKLQAVLLLEGGMPNPLWASGTARMSYSVLNGLVEGSTSFSVQIGEKCVEQKVDPFGGADLIADIDPGNDNDISVFAKPQVSLNVELREYDVPFTNPDGTRITRKFRLRVDSYTLTAGGRTVGASQLTETSTKVVLKPYQMLKAQTNHTVKIVLKAQERINGVWQPYKKNGKEWSVTDQRTFRTGNPPNRIVWENVEMTYPFRGEGAYIHGENRAKEGFFKFGVQTDYLFSPETASNRQWHSKIVVKFYKNQNYNSLQEVATTDVKTSKGKYFVFKMPATLPKNEELRCKVMRVYYQNPSYSTSGKDQDAIVSSNNDYQINIKGKTYQNYSDTRPQDKELFAFNFTTSRFNNFYDKVNSTKNKVVLKTETSRNGFGTGRSFTYSLGGPESFSYEEMGKRRILESNTTNRGMVEFSEDYYSSFYSKVFDYFEYERDVMAWMRDNYIGSLPANIIAKSVYKFNTKVSIDSWYAKDRNNRRAGFSNQVNLVFPSHNGYGYDLVSDVLFWADSDAARTYDYTYALVETLIPKYWSPLHSKLVEHIPSKYKLTHEPPRGNMTIKMRYWTPEVKNGKIVETSSALRNVSFKY